MSKRLFSIITIALVGLLLAACGLAQPVPVAPAEAPVSEPVETVEPEQAAGQEEQILNIYNWDTYIDPIIVSNFEEKFKVKINYETYGSNEEMLAVIQANPGQYDLIVPTDYMVAQMRREDLLLPLTKANVPNLDNIDPLFLSPAFDPGNRYCVPYQWGTQGIGYNLKATGREIQGLADLFDPAFAGRVALLDDSRASLGAILLYLGYSPNTTNHVEIAEAADFLKNQKDQIAAYLPDTGQDALAAGQVDLTLEYSGDMFQVMADHPDLRYVIPAEGSIIWTDNMCIPAGAPHQALAEKFINYILEPEVGAMLSNFVQYATPNHVALPLLNPDDRNNPALYPLAASVREKLFFVEDLGPTDESLYTQAWAEILAEHEQGRHGK
ncbi:MAG TPA: spermidine/putrescine ABC transporter substrate-binding protein [Anaerolineae bacterium]|nr:spermidine/putrescine ABC transporter substrate-binding protein [Anaerolineae bacterium]